MYTQIAWKRLKNFLKPVWSFRPSQNLAIAGGSLLMAVMIIVGSVYFDDIINLINLKQRVYVESEEGDQKLPEFGDDIIWLDGNEGQYGESATLIYFWNSACVSCQELINRVNIWEDRYEDDDLKVISVYSPRYEFEADLDLINKSIKRNDISSPVGIDVDYKFEDSLVELSDTFANSKETALVLADGDKNIRHVDVDAENLYTTELVLQGILNEDGQKLSGALPTGQRNDGKQVVNGLFFGNYEPTNSLFVGEKKITTKPNTFSAAEGLGVNNWTVSGGWSLGDSYIRSESDSTFISVFSGKEVYMVAESLTTGKDYFGVKVTDSDGNDVDAAPDYLDRDSLGEVDEPKVYQLVSAEKNLSNAQMVLTLPDKTNLYQIIVLSD